MNAPGGHRPVVARFVASRKKMKAWLHDTKYFPQMKKVPLGVNARCTFFAL